MTRTRKRKLFFRAALVVAFAFGLGRGWLIGLQANQPGARTQAFTVRVDSDEIGMHLDSWSGELAALNGAGYHWAIPGMSEVFRISRKPGILVLGGETDLPMLNVRSADGSGFHFKEVRLAFRVSEARALDYLRDSGSAAGVARQWVGAMGRSILREEFGVHTIQEVTDALVCDAARGRAFARLEVELIGHGIELLEITASKPSFDREYELAIAQRKVADQEVERLGEELKLKLRERDERLVKTDSEITARDKLLDGELDKLRIMAQTSGLGVRGSVDVWALKRLSDGRAKALELEAKATTIAADGQRARAAFVDELAALEGHGDVAIRERLVANLKGIRFKLTPFLQDSTPTTVDSKKGIFK